MFCHGLPTLQTQNLTKRNQKVQRKALKPKPPFRSQSKAFDGSKFVPICHHCGVIGHIRP